MRYCRRRHGKDGEGAEAALLSRGTTLPPSPVYLVTIPWRGTSGRAIQSDKLAHLGRCGDNQLPPDNVAHDAAPSSIS